MKAAIAALGLSPDNLTILIAQMVTLKRGTEVVRASKRAGDFITLRELAEEVGVDACRYFFLARAPSTQMEFDLELAKKESAENPVYYIQYAHARNAGILNLARSRGIDWNGGDVSLLADPNELNLIRTMLRLPELVEQMARTLEPHHLPHYAMELATAFHWFYENCRVISADAADNALTLARLKLVESAQIVFRRAPGVDGDVGPGADVGQKQARPRQRGGRAYCLSRFRYFDGFSGSSFNKFRMSGKDMATSGLPAGGPVIAAVAVVAGVAVQQLPHRRRQVVQFLRGQLLPSCGHGGNGFLPGGFLPGPPALLLSLLPSRGHFPLGLRLGLLPSCRLGRPQLPLGFGLGFLPVFQVVQMGNNHVPFLRQQVRAAVDIHDEAQGVAPGQPVIGHPPPSPDSGFQQQADDAADNKPRQGDVDHPPRRCPASASLPVLLVWISQSRLIKPLLIPLVNYRRRRVSLLLMVSSRNQFRMILAPFREGGETA